VFQTPKDINTVLKKQKPKPNRFFTKLFGWTGFKDEHEWTFERAYEPTDILWENLSFGPSFCRATVSFLFFLVLMFVNIICLYGLKKAKGWVKQSEENAEWQSLLTFTITLVLAIFNALLLNIVNF